MTIRFFHSHCPSSPVSVTVVPDGDSEEPKSAAAQKTRSVSFCPNVQVYRRFVCADEEVVPRSTLYYSRSEFREIKREINDLKHMCMYEQLHSFHHHQQYQDDAFYCTRGVEHVISSEIKKQKEQRRANVWFIVADIQEQQEDASLHSSCGSWSDDSSLESSSPSCSSSSIIGKKDEALGLVLRMETAQSALEAVQRAQQDAKTAWEEYHRCGIVLPVVVAPAIQSSRRSILKKQT